MTKSSAIVNRFYDIWRHGTGDFTPLLTEDVQFRGPMNSWTGREQFLREADPVRPSVKSIDLHHQFENGDEVCSIYAMELQMPSGSVTLNAAEYIRLEGGRIKDIQLYCDPRELAAAMAG